MTIIKNLLLIAIIVSLPLKSQNVVQQWCVGGTKNETPGLVIKTKDQGFVISYTSNSNDYDLKTYNSTNRVSVLEKYNQKNQLMWRKIIQIANVDLDINSLIETSNGKLILFIDYKGRNDLYINTRYICFSSLGVEEWYKNYEYQLEVETEVINNVLATKDGGCLITGSVYSKNGLKGTSRLYLRKLKNNGDFHWGREIGSDKNGCSYCFERTGFSIPTKDGNYTLISEFVLNPLSSNDKGLLFYTFNLEGTELWYELFQGNTEFGVITPMKAIHSESGNYYVAGEFASSAVHSKIGNFGEWDLWLGKFDNKGVFDWQTLHGGSKKDNFVDMATYNGDLFMLGRTGASGDFRNTGADGQVTDNHNWRTYDYTMCKIDENGSVKWHKCYGGSDNEYPAKLKVDNEGNLYPIGTTRSGDYDIRYKYLETNVWALKVSSQTGDILSSETYGGNSNEGVYDVEILQDNSLVVLANANSNTGFVSCVKGGDDLWVLRMGDNLSTISDTENKAIVPLIYPNPTSVELKIQYDCIEYLVKLFDNNGNLVYQEISTSPMFDINTSSLANGLYCVEIRNNNSSVSYFEKIIIAH